jgi:hypothetical protein
MKKVVFIITVFIILSLISGVLFAKTETEYDKAVRYYNTGKYKEAVEIFKDYIKTNPEAPAYYRIGYALYELGAYDEANKYFKQAYLIDPSFSPDVVAPKIKTKPIPKPPVAQAPPSTEPQVPFVTEKQPVTPSAPVPGPKPQMQMEPHKPQEQVTAPIQKAPPGTPGAVPPGEEAPPQAGRVVTPQRTQPPAGFPEFPAPPEGMPTDIPGLGTGMMAGFGMIMTVLQIISLLVYIFFCYCIFRIAKRLDIPAPWLAFIPIIQIWTIVSCAGKPWWWILLLLVPLVNIIIWFIIWMSISENVGKSKVLGFLIALFMIIPIIGYLLPAILAFSKSETYEGPVEDITTA